MNILNRMASALATGAVTSPAPSTPTLPAYYGAGVRPPWIHAGDPADGLPFAARQRYEALKQQVDDAQAGCDALHAKRETARENAADARRALTRLTRDKRLADDHAAVVDARSRLMRAEGELARLNALFDERSEVRAAVLGVTQTVEDYLRRDVSGELKTIEAFASPTIRKGISATEACDAARSAIVALKSRLREIERAPRPSAEAKARASRQINQLVERGRPDVGYLFSGGDIKWPEAYGQPFAIGEPPLVVRTPASIDALALTAWFQREELLAAVNREIDRQANDNAALNDQQRATALAETRAALLLAERQEEWLIEKAALTGTTIFRRRDADARAILGLSDECPPPRGL